MDKSETTKLAVSCNCTECQTVATKGKTTLVQLSDLLFTDLSSNLAGVLRIIQGTAKIYKCAFVENHVSTYGGVFYTSAYSMIYW